MKKISVIIPCYNVEPYIDRCLHSIENQTIGIENLEVIVVNDASTDHTLDKLCEWEQKYPDNILVITYSENLRQGGARNQGIRYATADYIGFVDSDDWIEPDMFDILYHEAVVGNYDMVQCKYIESDHMELLPSDVISKEYNCIRYNFGLVTDDIYDFNVSSYGEQGENGGIWSAIYKKDIIINNEIWFPEKLVYEDNYWTAVLHLYVSNLCVVDKILYHYFVNNNSTVRSRNTLHHLDRLPIEIGILDEYKQRGVFDYFYNRLYIEFLERFYINSIDLFFIKLDQLPDIFTWMEEQVFNYFPDCKERYYGNPDRKYSPFEEILIGLLGQWHTLSMEQIEEIRKAYVEELLNFLSSIEE